MRQQSWNRIGFALLGLTNNYGYVIMLSAAYDLLKIISDQNNSTPITGSNKEDIHKLCNKHGTSTILLADTIPSLFIKILYPIILLEIPIVFRVILTILSSIISFIITGISSKEVLIFTGVVFASISSGTGEATFLSITPQYNGVALGGWAIGTGVAGFLGAFAYTLLAMVLDVKTIMLIMIIAPFLMAVSYFVIINPVTEEEDTPIRSVSESNRAVQIDANRDHDKPNTSINVPANNDLSGRAPSDTGSQKSARLGPQSSGASLSGIEKLMLLPSLAQYFLPLTLVYFAEYFINHGLFELIHYDLMTQAQQYRWYQVTYQTGVLVSRSSIEFLKIKYLWTMALLQCVNLFVLLLHATFVYQIPSFYIVIVIIFFEGLLGGFAYVNTFDRITNEVDPKEREFAISVVTIADSLGIVFAAFSAIPVHDAICDKFYPRA